MTRYDKNSDTVLSHYLCNLPPDVTTNKHCQRLLNATKHCQSLQNTVGETLQNATKHSQALLKVVKQNTQKKQSNYYHNDNMILYSN